MEPHQNADAFGRLKRHPLASAIGHAAVAMGLTTASLLPGMARAADAPAAPAPATARAYDIPAGPLEGALNRLGREAGILLSFPTETTAGLQSKGLHGRYDVPDALARQLQGTGLAAVAQANGGYALVRRIESSAAVPGASGNEAALPPVTVRADAAREDSYRAPPTASVMRSDTPLLDTPQVVNVVPAQALRDQRPRNLDDALGNISGITQGNTLAGTQDTIMKRGFGGNRDGSVMHNGMPLIQGRGLNAAADSVEVLKGPSSLLYGIMDPGGVINIVSKRPMLEQYNAISVLGSTYGHGKNGAGATLDSTGPIGTSGLAYRLVVDQVDEQYWRNFGEHRETLVAPSLAWYGKDTQVVLSYEYRKFLYPFDRGTAIDPKTNEPLAIPSRRRLDEPFNSMDGQSHLVQLAVDHQFNADWKGHFGYSYNRESYDANQLRVFGVNSTTGVLSRSNDATHGALSTDSYGIAYVDGRFNVAGLRNDLQVVAQPGHVEAAIHIGNAVAVRAQGAMGGVIAARQHAGGGVDPEHAQLVGVVALAVVAVAEVSLPVGIELVIDRQLHQVRLPVHAVERLIQPAPAGDGQRLVGLRVDGRAAIERIEKLPVFVGQDYLRVLAVPGQRRRYQRLAMLAEVAPVLLVDLVHHQAISQAGGADGAGGIQRGARAVLAVAIGGAEHGDGVVLLKHGPLADDVDHAARIHDAVQQRGRALEHLHAVGRRVEPAALYQGHAVVHHRAIAIAAKAALHDGVLRAGQRIALGDAADIAERVVQVAGTLIAQRLGRHHVHHLRRVEQGRVRTHHGCRGRGTVAVFTGGIGAHGDRRQGGLVAARARYRCRGLDAPDQRIAAVGLRHGGQARALQLSGQRVRHVITAVQALALQASRGFRGEREQDAGFAAQAVERALQRAGRDVVGPGGRRRRRCRRVCRPRHAGKQAGRGEAHGHRGMPDGGRERMSLEAAEGVGVLMRFHIRWLGGGWEMWCAYLLCHARIENRPPPAAFFREKG